MTSAANISQVIFVIGFPRSGTTWFSNLINSHPDTAYRHEAFGRHYRAFGRELFHKLKFGRGLSDEDHASVMRILLRAHVDTDRPPFFRKRFRPHTSARIQKLAWLAARAAPPLAPLYGWWFTPAGHRSVALVVKETRSSVNLDSIIKGVRADKLIVLARHPYAVIGSHLDGVRRGTLAASTPEFRREWLAYNADTPYVRERGFSASSLSDLQEAEFLAIWWRVQNESYLAFQEQHPCSRLVVYETYLQDVSGNTERLLEFLGLAADEQVHAFITASGSSEMGSMGLLEKDGSSEYYSVYRGKSFDPNRWRRILTFEQLELIDRHTAPLVQRLGLSERVEQCVEP
jgi:Sulfotransferase family